MRLVLLIGLCWFISCTTTPKHISTNAVIPSEKQMQYQQMEFIGFIHFSLNTFTNKEWGFGNEDPALFNPTQLNTDQWAKTAKAAGMKQLILTAKHHDGFCLWPTKYTEYNISKSPYKNGEGDIVAEFVASCKKYGLKAGLYLSPWDRNHKDYGKPAYVTYYKNQLTELLTKYGEINEIWFDGANGGDGYYGGANESRRINAETYYGWPSIFELARTLQPNINIFSDAGPDVHWIGNEQGFAGDPFWSTMDIDSVIIGQSDAAYLNRGDELGKNWVVGQCDVSIRPGWFYHQEEESKVKTVNQLVDIYDKSVGRNAVLLLNLPPDERGLIHENDVATLQAFKRELDNRFKTNLALKKPVSASSVVHHFIPMRAVDGSNLSYWGSKVTEMPAWLEVDLGELTDVNMAVIQEPIQYGQRIRGFAIDVWIDNDWQTVFEGKTIGFKRIVSFPSVKTTRLRLTITDANNDSLISSFELYNSSTQ